MAIAGSVNLGETWLILTVRKENLFILRSGCADQGPVAGLFGVILRSELAVCTQ